jgi:uncharacterized protein YndB with AHSA1/START domain
MAVFGHEIFIERPIDAVFAAVADVRTHPKWQRGLIETDARDSSPRAGDNGVEVRRIWGRPVRFPYEITRFEPPRTWGFRALDGPIRPSAVLSFRTSGSGTTVTSQLTIPGVAGWLLGPVMLRQQKRNYRQLKALLETGKL